MGRAPCCDKASVKRGPWSPEEDAILRSFVELHGTGGNWISLPQKAGLKRCGKSCRLRWLNYLRPDIKHGGFTEEEDQIIYTFYRSIGSRWSVIAAQLPGRTDNDVKNYWNTKLMKRIIASGGSIHPPSNKLHRSPQESSSTVLKSEAFPFELYQLAQFPTEFSITGYAFSPVSDELSVSSAATSSSITVDEVGGNSYFDEAAASFFPELVFSSWEPLTGFMGSATSPESMTGLWENSDVKPQCLYQSLTRD